ncbi:hypothetical protein [Mycolicibacterium mageritense]|uniref:hypothetical protein n=1 Tax=Mycolicibacterium mageritense TaxID=53462 RepID=UPI001E55B1B6|nr:hypothetical protein [Mycolicibacterium mageritense]MCC9184090.1 hypothetical protein [Mycolicibacterium mageritense]
MGRDLGYTLQQNAGSLRPVSGQRNMSPSQPCQADLGRLHGRHDRIGAQQPGVHTFVDPQRFPPVALAPCDGGENREIIGVEWLHTLDAAERFVTGTPVISAVRRPRDDQQFGSSVDHDPRYRERVR